MSLLFSNKNIKFTIIDSIDSNLNQPAVELIIKRDFLKHFLMYLDSLNENKANDDYVELTAREKQVLECLSKGYNNAKIAEQLSVSIHTAKVHVRNIFKKLSVKDRTEAVVKAIKDNLLQIQH